MRSNYFLHCFSTDQSEAELQIVSRSSHHDIIIVAFEVIIEIEMYLHGPAKKNNRKTHLKKQNFMFNNKKEQLFFIEQIVIIHRIALSSFCVAVIKKNGGKLRS
jgi:hypothetical protein